MLIKVHAKIVMVGGIRVATPQKNMGCERLDVDSLFCRGIDVGYAIEVKNLLTLCLCSIN